MSALCEGFWPCKNHRHGDFSGLFFCGTRMAIIISCGSDPADRELLLVVLVLGRRALCTQDTSMLLQEESTVI